jgi:hypothetical protein
VQGVDTSCLAQIKMVPFQIEAPQQPGSRP